MIPGAVLAAGRSARMGRSKALLPFGRSYPVTFVEHAAESLRQAGVDDILVVGRPEDETLVQALERLAVATRFVANVNHEQGQLTSIIAAVNAVDRPGVRGLLVLPVDMPLVQVRTIQTLLEAFAAAPSSIVRPAHRGRHGHPVIFDRSSFDPLRRANPSVGAKSVLRDHERRVVNVEVEDEGALRDIDSVEDYVAVFGATPESFES